MNRYFIYGLIILFCAQCITPLDVELSDEFEPILIVEGHITNQPGPHLIKISRSNKFITGNSSYIENVNDAKVTIRDDYGNTILLSDSVIHYIDQYNSADGCGEIVYSEFFEGYKTPEDFSAIDGRSYTLEIYINENERYISTPQTMPCEVKLDSVYTQFEQIITSNQSQLKSKIEVYASWQDPIEEQNFYLWNVLGTYNYFSTPTSERCILCCSQCYMDEAFTTLYPFSDIRSNGGYHVEPIIDLEYDGIRFSSIYQLTLEQLSVPKSAYQFYSLLKTQLDLKGDLFDSPPAKIRGNIYPISPNIPKPLGYFGVYSSSRKTTIVENKIPKKYTKTATINSSCVFYNLRGYTTKPSFWLN